MDSSAIDTLFAKSVPHIFEKIFFSMDYKSLQNCTQVSKSWDELLTSESFKTLGKSAFLEDIVRDLHEASNNGNLMAVKSILSSGMADVNCTWGELRRGSTAPGPGNEVSKPSLRGGYLLLSTFIVQS